MFNWRGVLSTDAILANCIEGLKALCIQPYDEINKKLGNQWEASRLLTVNSTDPIYSVIVTGSLPVDLKSRVLGYDGIGVIGRIYKNPTYTGGASDKLYNMRPDLVDTSPQLQLLSSPTVTDVGQQCGADIYGVGPSSNQSRGATPQHFGSNRILIEPNTAYLLEIVPRDSASQTIMARIELYEGELDV